MLLTCRKFGVFVFLLYLAQACGAKYETNHVQDYKLFIETDDDDLLETVQILSEEYNDDFGSDVLSIVGSRDEANSFIRFRSGLRRSENKLGLGQWITVTTEEGPDLLPRRDVLDRTVVYSMEIDFDLENFQSKSDGRFDHQSPNWKHLYHLFCHEVGHGFQMLHSNERLDVMFPSIPEASLKDLQYDEYFERARAFFQRSHTEPLSNGI